MHHLWSFCWKTSLIRIGNLLFEYLEVDVDFKFELWWGLWWGSEILEAQDDLYIHLLFKIRWCAVLGARFAQIWKASNPARSLISWPASTISLWTAWYVKQTLQSLVTQDCVCRDEWQLLVTAFCTNGAFPVLNTASRFSRCAFWSRNTRIKLNYSSLHHYVRGLRSWYNIEQKESLLLSIPHQQCFRTCSIVAISITTRLLKSRSKSIQGPW